CCFCGCWGLLFLGWGWCCGVFWGFFCGFVCWGVGAEVVWFFYVLLFVGVWVGGGVWLVGFLFLFLWVLGWVGVLSYIWRWGFFVGLCSMFVSTFWVF
ncbi:hypothetical protein PUR61_01190, partial [Streptomyces sp. BE20]|uniref:hypothetical protein n=1 Tax=Streptomyces sp. BE20 TaxID=3002525 RepID=UPI002E7A5D3C